MAFLPLSIALPLAASVAASLSSLPLPPPSLGVAALFIINLVYFDAVDMTGDLCGTTGVVCVTACGILHVHVISNDTPLGVW